MTRLSIDQGYEPVEVDLWNNDFHTRPSTRSTAKLATTITEKLSEPGVDEDATVKLICELLDMRLVPAAGKRTKASTLIIRKWENDELSLPQLIDFVGNLGDADRPT